ncbi:MAG: lipid A biosynthesis acyltransferase [Flavobacteriales bacterium]|nr:lipid A biosynthesis acyltransferase [Flavobacteriales bacterium]
MNALVYYITLPLIYLISLSPFWLMYRLSDLIYLLLYYVIGYRKKVVYTNLKNSFPEKSEKELLSIQKKFYKYFCDLVFETFKSLTISPRSLKKRIKFDDVEIFQPFVDKDQSVIIAMGHFGNWELGGARFAVEPIHKLYVIYHPLHNKYFNNLIIKMRTRLGNGLYPMKESLKLILGNRNDLTATAFIADQTPSPKGAYWTTFMNQDTPVFMGMGKISNKLNYPIIYVGIERVKRGYYDMKAELLVENPKELQAEEIVERFTRRLEKDIQRVPHIWLWTHRRWKHKRKIEENA